MRVNHVKIINLAVLLAGIFCLAYLLTMPLDADRGHLLNYGVLRSIFLAGMSLGMLALSALAFKFQADRAWGKALADRIDHFLTEKPNRLAALRFSLIITFIFLIEAFLLTWFTVPLPARPLILWLAAACLAALVTLRVVYRGVFRERPSPRQRARSIYESWTLTQRRVFIILVVLGVLYFAAFIPVNFSTQSHPDEDTIYPDVVNMLIGGDTFAETLRDSFVISSWWYGYPYFPISALPLVIPRLIYGVDFASHLDLNLLLMRQFVSVLPMVLSIIFLIYLVNGFKNLWASVGMAVVLALIPGVIHYNIRFWHPDSIIVLLVLLTIWLLKRDRLRFGANFYLAACAVGLNAVIKVWGLFFFLAIGGYLLAGWITRKLSFWKMVRAGLFFILVMIAAIIITSPSILIPWNLKTYIAELQEYYPVLREGYDEPDPQGVYRTGLPAWMVFFRMHFMQDFYFYFAVFAAVAGSLLGSRKMLNRLILAWSAVVGTYLVGWIAVKSFQYMLPLMIPLYGSAFLFPQVAGAAQYPKPFGFLARPAAKKVLIIITVVLTALQFWFNLKLFPG